MNDIKICFTELKKQSIQKPLSQLMSIGGFVRPII